MTLNSPTPIASALASLAFILVLAVIYSLFTLFRGNKAKKTQNGSGAFERLISGVRWLDRALVNLFSWLTGTRYRRKFVRLPVILSYFLTLLAASVVLPWPYGMGFIAFGVFSIFIVFRHWSRDEDEALAGISFERKDIKIEGTLGTEVLVAVSFILVFTPVAFAQLQSQGLGFTLDQDAGPFTFLVYTLIETVKAGSIVDYYDLYADRIGFETIGAPTDPSKWAKVAIMGYRLSLNLLVLAAIKRLLDVAKRRAEGADLRAIEEALRREDSDKQKEAVLKLRDFALKGRGNARDMLEQIAEPRQSEHLPIAAETRFAASGALLDYGKQRGGASALYAAADGYRALMSGGFDRETELSRWRAAAHNLGNTLVELGQQIGDSERLRDAADVFEQVMREGLAETSEASHLNTMIARANVSADLAMMTGDRADLDMAVERYREALEFARAGQHSEQIAMLNTNLGATLADIAEIEADQEVIQEAISAYRSALEHLSEDDDTETWSMAQNNLGNALADLGFWTSDRAALEEAIVAHEHALSKRQPEDAPLLWAMSQTNLANATTRLAKLTGSPELLRTAIEHYRAAQTVYQREDFPRDWAWSVASLASAFIDLAQMTDQVEEFERALNYCEDAIDGYTSVRIPLSKAWVCGLKGNALIGLKRYGDAAEAYKAALALQSYQSAGEDWVMSCNNLAACLFELGDRAGAFETLERALQEAPENQRLLATRAALSLDQEET